MKVDELKEELIRKSFKEERQDTGYLYSKTVRFVELLCYIEPGMNVAFTSVYSWNDNAVKGTYIIDVKELDLRHISLPDLFKATLSDMPAYVGEKDIHAEVRRVVDNLFE